MFHFKFYGLYHYNEKRFDFSNDQIKNLIHYFEESKSRLHSIDECYFSEKVLAHYGWSKRGIPLRTKMQPKGWKKRSLLMMVQNNGTYKYIVVHGSINKEIFNKFMVDHLPSQDKVLLDNCAFHKCHKDDRNIFIPPYCPMFNPIEYCFAKIKSEFRKLYTSGDYSFDDALQRSIKSLKDEHIINSFSHVYKSLQSEFQTNQKMT